MNYFYKKDTGELPAHTKNIFAENEFLTIHNLIAQQAVVFMQKVSAHIVPKPTFDNFEIMPRNGHDDVIATNSKGIIVFIWEKISTQGFSTPNDSNRSLVSPKKLSSTDP